MKDGPAGIENQIQKDLLELDTIALDRGKPGGEPPFNLHAAGEQIAACQPQHILDAVVDVERLMTCLAPLQQGTELLDDLPGPPILGHDVLQDGRQFGEVGRVAPEQALGGLAVGQDDAERLVEFVGQ